MCNTKVLISTVNKTSETYNMKYERSEEHELIRDSIKNYLDSEVAPYVDEFESKGEFPDAIFRELMGMGYLSTLLSEEYGGGGHDFFATAVVGEELAKCCGGLHTSVGGHIFCQHWIDMFGNKEQKDKFLPMLSNGGSIGAIAITEPDAGSNVAGIKTRAVEQDDHFVLTGNKIFITNGNVADVICVMAVTDPDSRPTGISTFIFETDTPGFQAGRPMKKLGNKCSPTCELSFDNCKVPKENLLGTKHRSLQETMEFFSYERVSVAIGCGAVIEACMDACIDYSKERIQFDVPIASFQGIQEMIAEMGTDTYAIRCMAVDLMTKMEQGQYDVTKASMLKAFASEVVNKHTSNAIQIFGGAGYTQEYPVERYYRDARVWSIGGGTTQIQNRLIARDLMSRR